MTASVFVAAEISGVAVEMEEAELETEVVASFDVGAVGAELADGGGAAAIPPLVESSARKRGEKINTAPVKKSAIERAGRAGCTTKKAYANHDGTQAADALDALTDAGKY